MMCYSCTPRSVQAKGSRVKGQGVVIILKKASYKRTAKGEREEAYSPFTLGRRTTQGAGAFKTAVLCAAGSNALRENP